MLRADPSVRVSSRAHKMSKSRGNVVNPDDVVTMYGADSLRLYEMFMGPLRDTKVCTLTLALGKPLRQGPLIVCFGSVLTNLGMQVRLLSAF